MHKHKPIPPEAIELINKTPFLIYLCYDLDLLPEQFVTLKDNESYPIKFAQLMGVLQCYTAFTSQIEEENKNAQAKAANTESVQPQGNDEQDQ